MTLAEARQAWAEWKKIRDRSLDPRIEKKKTIEAEAEKIQAAYSVDDVVEDWIYLHVTKLAGVRESVCRALAVGLDCPVIER